MSEQSINQLIFGGSIVISCGITYVCKWSLKQSFIQGILFMVLAVITMGLFSDESGELTTTSFRFGMPLAIYASISIANAFNKISIFRKTFGGEVDLHAREKQRKSYKEQQRQREEEHRRHEQQQWQEQQRRQEEERRWREEQRRREEERRWQEQQRRQEEERRRQEQQRRQEEERRRQEQQRASSRPTESDYHKTLGTEPGMNFAEIKKAYHKKVMQYHPDKVSQLGEKLREVAEEEMKKINEAYNYFQQKYQ